MAVEREIPYCTLFLVVGTLSCHLMTLVSNLSTATMLHGFGTSTHGWSDVGGSLATAMRTELEGDLDNVSDFLSKTISVSFKLESGIDMILSASGSFVDTALDDFNSTNNVTTVDDVQHFKTTLVSALHTLVEKLLDTIDILVGNFVDMVSPALETFAKWLISFGEKLQPSLEEFGTTIDRVQKVFDQVMAKLSPSAGGNEETMLQNAYALVDTDNSGNVDAGDLRSVAKLYGISALAGSKADGLFVEYDSDHNGNLDIQEFGLFVHDPSIPGIMTLMIRTYAKQLSTAAGRVAGGKMRDELARAVTDYAGVVCAKNMTKIKWVAQSLTNGSLPAEFTADILKNLALDAESPDKLTRVQIGSELLANMVKLNSSHTIEALQLMSNPVFWDSEGFDPEEQPPAVEHIVRWLLAAPGGAEALRHGLGIPLQDIDAVEEKLPEAAARLAASRSADYRGKMRSRSLSSEQSMYQSRASQHLKEGLLGGVSAVASGDNPDAQASTRSGVPALPVTLQFASWLAANASSTADQYQQDCFDYSGESSSPLGSIANEVSSIIKKVQGPLNLMSKYATASGFEQLIGAARGFTKEAKRDVTLALDNYIDGRLRVVECSLNQTKCSNAEMKKDLPVVLTGAFSFIVVTLQELKSVIPVVVENLKFAKSEVSKVHAGMTSVFDMLRGKAPPLFYQISQLYKTVWIAYFVLFVLLTLGMGYYGFWSSGWFGGPQVSMSAEEMHEPPRTCMDRLRVCCKGCNACLRGCHDSHITFWSLLILMEIVVLLIFVCAMLVCIIGGLEAFMSAGCSQVYVLEDRTVCTVALKTMRSFLSSFWSSKLHSDIEKSCQAENLLTCRLIAEQTSGTLKLSAIGGILASVLSFQLLADSAVKHEQVIFRRLLNAEDKNRKEA